MITANTEQTTTSQSTGEQPKATKKARVGVKGARVAPAKGKSAKTATPAKKPTKGHKKGGKPLTREGSKTAQILELLKRPGGATLQDLMKVTEWQPHSIRGFISGTLGKKMGLLVESAKSEGGKRTYSIKS